MTKCKKKTTIRRLARGMEFSVCSLLARVPLQMGLPGETCMKLTSEESPALWLSLKIEKCPLAISSSMTQEWGIRLYNQYERVNNPSKSEK